jgi:hypothetical protein
MPSAIACRDSGGGSQLSSAALTRSRSIQIGRPLLASANELAEFPKAQQCDRGQERPALQVDVGCACSTAKTMLAKLSSAKISRPASFATLVPLPIAMPTSAALIAGASLTPSPVMATMSRFFLRVSASSTLCPGAKLPDPVDRVDLAGLERLHQYYDPVHTLPEAGQRWRRSVRSLSFPASRAAPAGLCPHPVLPGRFPLTSDLPARGHPG